MNVLILGPEARNAPILEHILETGHRCEVINTPVSRELLSDVDWIVVNGYAPIIKKWAIDQMQGRVINVHPSHLPYGRGIFPLFWALFHGWPVGVCLHQIDEGIDTGPLFARKVIEFNAPTETLSSLNDRLLHEATVLFSETWTKIALGDLLPQEQEPESARLVSKHRTQSETFVELLPQLWETPVGMVSEMGNAFRSNLDFIQKSSLCA